MCILKKPTSLRLKKVAIFLAINTVIAFLLLVAAELYLRRTSTYIIKQNSEKGIAIVPRSPHLLMKQTPNGRRFVPDTHVIIKNHYLS